MLFYEQGVEIEFKGESLSLHYRKACDQQRALAQIAAAIQSLESPPGRIDGKSVVNVIPIEAFSKGEALVAAMDRCGSQRAVYFGDDINDEEVFKVTNVNVFGIRIGKDE